MQSEDAAVTQSLIADGGSEAQRGEGELLKERAGWLKPAAGVAKL